MPLFLYGLGPILYLVIFTIWYLPDSLCCFAFVSASVGVLAQSCNSRIILRALYLNTLFGLGIVILFRYYQCISFSTVIVLYLNCSGISKYQKPSITSN